MFDWFAQEGFEVHALDLRGHGGSDGAESLQFSGIAEYVDDLAAATSMLDRLPVLVGHSMGGLVVQKYLERLPVAGSVLMSSVPVGGLGWQVSRVAMRHPLRFAQLQIKRSMSAIFESSDSVRALLLPPDASESLVAEVRATLGEESWRAANELLWLHPDTTRNQAPMLVLGGKLDALVPPDLITSTAQAYNAPCVLFEGMAHMLNMEPGWEQVATVMVKHIRQWAATPPPT
jgi:pimeloyl-ACP methyl ester carboxylesterase